VQAKWTSSPLSSRAGAADTAKGGTPPAVGRLIALAVVRDRPGVRSPAAMEMLMRTMLAKLLTKRLPRLLGADPLARSRCAAGDDARHRAHVPDAGVDVAELAWVSTDAGAGDAGAVSGLAVSTVSAVSVNAAGVSVPAVGALPVGATVASTVVGESVAGDTMLGRLGESTPPLGGAASLPAAVGGAAATIRSE